MFTVKCKHFADANFNKFLNIRKFFAIFLKKSSPSPPHSLIFAIKAREQVYQSTSQQVNELKSDESDESDRSDRSDKSDGIRRANTYSNTLPKAMVPS